MRAERDDRRRTAQGSPGRGASPRGARRADPQEIEAHAAGACRAAHERAVMTVRLTLLLLVVGAALFLFNGLGVVPAPGPELGVGVGRVK